MTINRLRNLLLSGAAGLLLMNTVQAGTPVWTFTPTPIRKPISVTVISVRAFISEETGINENDERDTRGIQHYLEHKYSEYSAVY
ncbi:MAG: hypothetical protein H0U57_14910 [Tatlockia sp.]|nr:hypothetical protein [Tatlockia sp.]